MLVEAGAWVQATMANGETPLHRAAFQNHGSVVVELLKCDGIVADSLREDGVTPLMLACMRGATSSVVALLEAGADPTRAEFKRHATPVMQAAQGGHLDAIGAIIGAIRISKLHICEI